MFDCQYLSVIIINDITRTESNHDNSFDIVFDVVFLAASIYDVCNNPDDPWAWVGLAGDVVDVLIPCVGGIGEITKAVSKGKKAIEAVDDVHDAAKTADRISDSIGTYKDLKKLNKGSGLEVHHIVEKRFAGTLDKNTNEMLSIALDPVQHRKYTNAWRKQIPYGKNKGDIHQIWEAAQKIYADNPSLLEAARKTIWR